MDLDVDDVVWAKMRGYSYWPAVLTVEPSSGMFKKGKGSSTKFHVDFLGGEWIPKWIKRSQVRKFEAEDTGPNRKKDYRASATWEPSHLAAMKSGLDKLLQKGGLTITTEPNQDKESSLAHDSSTTQQDMSVEEESDERDSSTTPQDMSLTQKESDQQVSMSEEFSLCRNEESQFYTPGQEFPLASPHQQFFTPRLNISFPSQTNQGNPNENQLGIKFSPDQTKFGNEQLPSTPGTAETEFLEPEKGCINSSKQKKTTKSKKKSLDTTYRRRSRRQSMSPFVRDEPDLVSSPQLDAHWLKPYKCRICHTRFAWKLERESHELLCEGEIQVGEEYGVNDEVMSPTESQVSKKGDSTVVSKATVKVDSTATTESTANEDFTALSQFATKVDLAWESLNYGKEDSKTGTELGLKVLANESCFNKKLRVVEKLDVEVDQAAHNQTNLQLIQPELYVGSYDEVEWKTEDSGLEANNRHGEGMEIVYGEEVDSREGLLGNSDADNTPVNSGLKRKIDFQDHDEDKYDSMMKRRRFSALDPASLTRKDTNLTDDEQLVNINNAKHVNSETRFQDIIYSVKISNTEENDQTSLEGNDQTSLVDDQVFDQLALSPENDLVIDENYYSEEILLVSAKSINSYENNNKASESISLAIDESSSHENPPINSQADSLVPFDQSSIDSLLRSDNSKNALGSTDVSFPIESFAAKSAQTTHEYSHVESHVDGDELKTLTDKEFPEEGATFDPPISSAKSYPKIDSLKDEKIENCILSPKVKTKAELKEYGDKAIEKGNTTSKSSKNSDKKNKSPLLSQDKVILLKQTRDGSKLETQTKTYDKAKSAPKNHDQGKSTTKTHDLVKAVTKTHGQGKSATKSHDQGKSESKTHDKVKSSTKIHDQGKSASKLHDKAKSATKTHDQGKSASKTHDKAKSASKTRDQGKSATQTHKVKLETKTQDELKSETQDKVESATKTHDQGKSASKTHDKVKSSTKTCDQVKSAFKMHDKVNLTKTRDKVKTTRETHDKVKTTRETHDNVKTTRETHDKVKTTRETHDQGKLTTKTCDKLPKIPKRTHDGKLPTTIDGKTKLVSKSHDKLSVQTYDDKKLPTRFHDASDKSQFLTQSNHTKEFHDRSCVASQVQYDQGHLANIFQVSSINQQKLGQSNIRLPESKKIHYMDTLTRDKEQSHRKENNVSSIKNSSKSSSRLFQDPKESSRGSSSKRRFEEVRKKDYTKSSGYKIEKKDKSANGRVEITSSRHGSNFRQETKEYWKDSSKTISNRDDVNLKVKVKEHDADLKVRDRDAFKPTSIKCEDNFKGKRKEDYKRPLKGTSVKDDANIKDKREHSGHSRRLHSKYSDTNTSSHSELRYCKALLGGNKVQKPRNDDRRFKENSMNVYKCWSRNSSPPSRPEAEDKDWKRKKGCHSHNDQPKNENPDTRNEYKLGKDENVYNNDNYDRGGEKFNRQDKGEYSPEKSNSQVGKNEYQDWNYENKRNKGTDHAENLFARSDEGKPEKLRDCQAVDIDGSKNGNLPIVNEQEISSTKCLEIKDVKVEVKQEENLEHSQQNKEVLTSNFQEHDTNQTENFSCKQEFPVWDSNDLRELPNYDVSTSILDKLPSKNIFDSHCHLDILFYQLRAPHRFLEGYTLAQVKNLNEFKKHYPGEIHNKFEGCVTNFCDPKQWNVTQTIPDLIRSLDREEGVYYTVGCHPRHADKMMSKMSREALERIVKWGKGKGGKCVAIGECGLDLNNSNPYKKSASFTSQKIVFKFQLELAMELNFPVVLHIRDAEEEAYAVMQEVGLPPDHPIHRHCFNDSWSACQTWMKTFPLSFIGITNLLLKPGVKYLHEVARLIPLERLILETDSPYFSPRVQSRIFPVDMSHPGDVVHVAALVAKLRKDSLQNILGANRRNIATLYRIKEEPRAKPK